MQNLKTNIIAGIAILGCILGLIGVFHKPSQSFGGINNGGSAGSAAGVTISANTTLPNGYQTPNPSTFDYLVSRGFLIAQGIFGYGNGTSVPTYQQVNRMVLNTATSTPCALQNPFNATSTMIDGIVFNVSVSTSSAGTLDFATSTSAFATTSLFSTIAAAANTQGTYTALPNSGFTVAPNGWVVVGVHGTSLGGYSYGGSCQATFQTIN